MAEWIRTRLGMVVLVELCIGILDFGGDRRRGMGSFGGEFGALHGCQWEVMGRATMQRHKLEVVVALWQNG